MALEPEVILCDVVDGMTTQLLICHFAALLIDEIHRLLTNRLLLIIRRNCKTHRNILTIESLYLSLAIVRHPFDWQSRRVDAAAPAVLSTKYFIFALG